MSHMTTSIRAATSNPSMSFASRASVRGHLFDHLIARIRHGVDRMPETDDDLFVRHALARISASAASGGGIAILDFEGHLVRAAMLGAAQRADGARDAGIHVGAGARDDPGGERRGIELVFGIQVQRGMHGAHPARRGFAAVQQVQEMRADGIIVGLHVDALPALRKVIPVAQHRTQGMPTGDPPDRARPRSCERRASGTQQPRADTPVRNTSIGWLLAGNCSSTVATAAGSARSPLSFFLYAASSRLFGNFSCTSK